MKKETYTKTNLIITRFGHDGIFTDTLAGSASKRTQNMLPIITLGSPITGIGGTDITGQRDTITP